MRTDKTKRRAALRWLAVLILAAALFLFLKSRKDLLVREGTRFLESALSTSSGMTVSIGKISGRLSGSLNFENVRVEEPWLPQGERTVFSAEQISMKYRFLDFVSKKFNSKIELTVKKPLIAWKPHLSVKTPEFPFMGWMRRWALSQSSNFVLRVESLKFLYGPEKKEIAGVDIFYEDNHFSFEVPLSHLNIHGADFSTVLKGEGRFELATQGDQDFLAGQIRTEGTIVNWRPTSGEAHFDFDFSRERFRLLSSDLLGGVAVSGSVDFARDYQINFTAEAERYPINHLAEFLGIPGESPLPEILDLELRFTGSLWEPRAEGRARIYRGRVGKRTFKAMDVHVEGVYPTLHLSDSRILMDDGTTMQFAEKDLEVRDLFKDKTYQGLVSEAQQETVVWGDWEFSRPRDSNNESEFLMQRVLGENARMHFRKFNEDREVIEPSPDDRREMEVGFEYRLKSKDSFKVEFREDEEFFGVEHKTKF